MKKRFISSIAGILFMLHVFSILFFISEYNNKVFAYKVTLQPRITANFNYTDNLFLDSGDDPNAPKEEDGYSLITPGFTAEISSRKQATSLSYDFGYTRYIQWSSRNSWHHNLGLKGWYQLWRHTRIEVADDLSYTSEPITDRHFEITRPEDSTLPEDYTARRERQPYLTNYGDITLIHRLGRNDFVILEYSNGTRFDFGNSVNNIYQQQSDDYIRHIPRVELQYWMDSSWGIGLEGRYDYGNFDVSEDVTAWTGRLRIIRRFSAILDSYLEYSLLHVSYGDSGETDNSELQHRDIRDYFTHSSAIGLEYKIAQDISLDLNAGVFIQDYEEGDTTVNFSGMCRFNKSYRHGSLTFYSSAGQALGVYTSESLGPSLYFEGGVKTTYQLKEFLGLNAYFSYRRDNYDEVPTQDGKPGDDGGIENNYGAGTGLAWQVMPWLSIDLSYSFHHLDSTHDIGLYDSNYTENRGMLTVKLSPEMPWRWIR